MRLSVEPNPGTSIWRIRRRQSVVVLTGTAKEGKAGLPLGTVDIGRSENAYLFRVGLPGVCRNASTFPVLLIYQTCPYIILTYMFLNKHLNAHTVSF